MPRLASTCNITIGKAVVVDQYARINSNYDSFNTNNNYLSFGHNSVNTLIITNNGYVGIKQTTPSCELDIYGSQNIQGDLTFAGANRALSGLTTMSILGTAASTSSSTGAIQCQGGAYLRSTSMIASNLVANGLTFGLGSSGSQSLTNNNIRFWGSTLTTQSINVYRASDTTGGNAQTISQLGASSVSQSLFQIDWKQSSVSTWPNQSIKNMLDFGNSRNYRTGYPTCHTLACSMDAFCINTLEGTANPSSGCLYLVSGSGSGYSAVDNLLFNTDTPYSNASYGVAGVTLNANMFIKSNNTFNDGTSSWNMPLCLSNGNASELLFAFQMDNRAASTSTTSVVESSDEQQHY
ncbi:hypothetical protein PF004_g27694 [Phytophthora fragariae]|uniref:Uncharacterized protein n=1 Tax=Phytophthora fragariae TaxID=53985 RepID=A0A6G0MJS5_9STRA|nr:hypothetical protein PF004_g27694 [Phytophthora fragariae]